MTNDARVSRLGSGLAFALLAAGSFGLSGTLARGLMDSGWSAAAATIVRVAIGAAVLLIPGILSMRGKWQLLRRGWATVVAYGLFAVAGAQLFYFLAVGYLDVGIALLIEYTAPVAVIIWLWLRHGSRPGPLTFIGAAVAAGGLALLLNVVGGASINLVGVAWALAAMVGCAVYFVISGDESNGLPPISLAAGGLVVAFVALSVAGLAGVLPVTFARAPVVFQSFTLPWWGVAGLLGVIAAAVAYVAGIAATRRLGARLGSFVALIEVVMATGFAWLLLGQGLVGIQWVGALLVLGGVVLVKMGEPHPPADTQESLLVEPLPADPEQPETHDLLEAVEREELVLQAST